MIFISGIRSKIRNGDEVINAKLIREGKTKELKLFLKNLTAEERSIILKGCLINYYKG
ncbi:MAG: hypothetical protein GXZ01_07770 [Clostridiaceae bacterium]|jgi:aconitate hydratase|nr:hypothetical protein [Clostridiaceae bacterium]